MSKVFFVLMAVSMLAVLGALLAGIVSMARGGTFNKKYGNKLMQARVWLQGSAVVFFLLAVLSAKK